MISRDIILKLPIRIREDNTIDYTDSAFLCGILSLFGSEMDRDKLYNYIHSSNALVRHPLGDANDQTSTHPQDTSRDALVAWSSTKTDNPSVNAARLSYARKWFINKDILLPHVRVYLYKQAQAKVDWYNLWMYPLAYIIVPLDILYTAAIARTQTVKAQHELNQSLCLANSYGKFFLKMLLKLHPTPDENMKDYFCSWRNQSEIYEMYLAWKAKV